MQYSSIKSVNTDSFLTKKEESEHKKFKERDHDYRPVVFIDFRNREHFGRLHSIWELFIMQTIAFLRNIVYLM